MDFDRFLVILSSTEIAVEILFDQRLISLETPKGFGVSSQTDDWI